MVKIAVAGGTGSVASEVIDALIATKKHELLILTRMDAPSTCTPGITYAKTSYTNVSELARTFQGTHTVLSFLAPLDQESGTAAQKCIIDACIQAGVKRFAPSEWVSAGLEDMSWYVFKGVARAYLAELNKESQVLEYTLFQPGYFTNYLVGPHDQSKHLRQIQTPIDFEGRRNLMAEGSEEAYTTWTTVEDLAGVVCRAVEYEGVWPVVGGIRGSRVTMSQLVAMGEKVRGGTKFKVEKIPIAEVKEQTFNTSWLPAIEHPSVPKGLTERISKMFTSGILLAIAAGAFDMSDEWNQLLPDYKFQSAEELFGRGVEGQGVITVDQ